MLSSGKTGAWPGQRVSRSAETKSKNRAVVVHNTRYVFLLSLSTLACAKKIAKPALIGAVTSVVLVPSCTAVNLRVRTTPNRRKNSHKSVSHCHRIIANTIAIGGYVQDATRARLMLRALLSRLYGGRSTISRAKHGCHAENNEALCSSNCLTATSPRTAPGHCSVRVSHPAVPRRYFHCCSQSRPG